MWRRRRCLERCGRRSDGVADLVVAYALGGWLAAHPPSGRCDAVRDVSGGTGQWRPAQGELGGGHGGEVPIATPNRLLHSPPRSLLQISPGGTG